DVASNFTRRDGRESCPSCPPASVSNGVVCDGAVHRRLRIRRQAAGQRFGQRNLQDLVHRLDHVDVQRVQHVFRNVGQVLLVVLRQDDVLDASPVRMPLSLLSSAIVLRKRGTPRYDVTLSDEISSLKLLPSTTTLRATLRQIDEISRSRFRTPASRV